MEVISLEMVKANSRIEGDAEDALLMELAAAAVEAVGRAVGRGWYEVEAEFGHIPAPLRRACLMLVDHFYTNRGATGPVNIGALPLGVRTLIKPYVRL